MSKIEQYKCDWCCIVHDSRSEFIELSDGQHICKHCNTKEDYVSKLFKDASNRLGSVSIEELLSDMYDSVTVGE